MRPVVVVVVVVVVAVVAVVRRCRRRRCFRCRCRCYCLAQGVVAVAHVVFGKAHVVSAPTIPLPPPPFKILEEAGGADHPGLFLVL